ncbi:MAG: histidine phosphatase family protein [Rhodopseudomonas palustris]|uniref:Histidine phosphatase family protein n=1 Tax=Rhodopseudomonas palustris TaxID=1076 RepID=A0A933RVQ3_RHOPL|nr:histidine phosphatase family protein [Rhodopseudomonas palustris]
MRHQSLAKLGLAAVLAGCLSVGAVAAPRQIIILRHGEKQDAYRLCQVGVKRSLALAAQYLGKGAEQSLFTAESPPAAFLAITLHTLELVSPAASSWDMPVDVYSALPMTGQTAAQTTTILNTRTQQAARDVMTNPAWDGKVVVMVWEHHHIANMALERQFAGVKVTLRQLLNLDVDTSLPDTWSGDNFDYFWIVNFAKGSDRPVSVEVRRQVFAGAFATVPSNEWGKPPQYPANSSCEVSR